MHAQHAHARVHVHAHVHVHMHIYNREEQQTHLGTFRIEIKQQTRLGTFRIEIKQQTRLGNFARTLCPAHFALELVVAGYLPRRRRPSNVTLV